MLQLSTRVAGVKRFFALATVVGSVVPYVFFFKQISLSGFSFVPFWSAIFSTHASTGFVLDLFISSFIFWAYIFNKVDRKVLATVIALNLTIGLAAAFPFYCYRTYGKTK